jgi:glycosyltransferase involved in cell wall biosynthesis
MRILCVGNIYPPQAPGGGYELTWQACVGQLTAHGHSVRVLTTDHVQPGVTAPDEGDVHRELRWYWRDHVFPRLPMREVVALERWNSTVLTRHLRDFAPDAVCWWAMGGISLALVEQVRRLGIPAAGVLEDEWLNWGPKVDGWQRRFRGRPRAAQLAERLTGLVTGPRLGDAALWLFGSEHIKRRALEDWRIPDGRVVHPGFDDVLFRDAPAPPWGWNLLYLGRMDPRKGVDLAVDALDHLPSEARLVLQGSGDSAYVDDLERRGGRRISFSTEPREAIPDIYAAADAVIFPVRWEEPWGIVPLEAMAVGRPVVASGTGGSREYLRHEQNCLIYEPRDSAEALASAVRRLASDAQLRERLRAGGLETAARYTERLHYEAIEAALLEVADR